MTFTKYLASIPLITNLLIVYIVYPYISSNQDVVWATQSIIILSFFLMTSAMHFGVPVFIVRGYKNSTKLGTNFSKILFSGIFFSLMFCFTYIYFVNGNLLWMLFFVPGIISVNYVRGLWEAKNYFLLSYLARMTIISIIPISLIFLLSFSTSLFLLFISITVLITVLFYLNYFHALKGLEGPIESQKNIAFIPFFIQFLYTFIFIFSDRFIIAFLIDEVSLANFVKEFEMVYRFASPMLFIGSILYPGLSSINKRESYNAVKELFFFSVVWGLVSFFIPSLFERIYDYYQYKNESSFFKLNSEIIFLTVFLIGISALGHRMILAFGNYKELINFYVILTFLIILSSLIAGILSFSALQVLFVKSIIEFFVIIFFLVKIYSYKKGVNFNLFLSPLSNPSIRRGLFTLLENKKNKNSYSIATLSNDYITKEILSFGWYEKPFLSLLRYLILDKKIDSNQKSVFIDVGANIGNHSIFFSNVVDKVIAIEPNPICLNLFNASLQINGIENVEIIPKGVSENKETLKLNFNMNHMGGGTFLQPNKTKKERELFDRILNLEDAKKGSFKKLEVELDSLDNLLKDRISKDQAVKLLKIDAEGFEPKIFNGAKNILKQHSPTVAFEAHGKDHFKKISEILIEEGYLSFYSIVQARRFYKSFFFNSLNMLLRPSTIKIKKIDKPEDIDYQMVLSVKNKKFKKLENLNGYFKD